MICVGEVGVEHTLMTVGIAGPVSPQGVADALGISISNFPAGMGGTPVTALVVALAREGYPVVVYSLSKDVERPVSVNVGPVRMHFGPYRSRPRDRAADFFKVERDSIASFVRDDPTNVVNAHWTYEFALGALKARADAIVTVHDWAPTILRFQPHPYRFIRLLMDRRAKQLARYMTCVSPHILNHVADATRAELFLVPNMTKTHSNVLSARSRTAGQRLLAANAGWGRLKNVDRLLTAFREVRLQKPQSQLLLCGPGYGPGEEAELWAAEHEAADGVAFVGAVDHSALLRLLKEADVFVHPSREESFGMVLTEAMSQGTPVIGGADSGAVPWVLDGGEAGVLVDVRDASAIAEAAILLLDDDVLWRHYSHAGRARVEACFSESVVLERYLAVYKEVLGR